MTGPGIYSYSITPASNVNANTGINWDEGMAPAAVNNSARQNMTDIRNFANDLIWFKYGKGDLDYSPVYASGTTFTIAGADLTTPYHVGRRVRAVGSSTGTIYGTISVTAFSTNTTVTVIWDSGSLSNETLVISLAQVPVTGGPISTHAIRGTQTNDDAAAGRLGEFISSTIAAGSAVSLTGDTPANITSISLTAGDWDVWGIVTYTGGATTNFTKGRSSISSTTAGLGTTGTTSRATMVFTSPYTPFAGDVFDQYIGPVRFSLAATTTVYLVARASFSVDTCSGYGQIMARRRR